MYTLNRVQHCAVEYDYPSTIYKIKGNKALSQGKAFKQLDFSEMMREVHNHITYELISRSRIRDMQQSKTPDFSAVNNTDLRPGRLQYLKMNDRTSPGHKETSQIYYVVDRCLQRKYLKILL